MLAFCLALVSGFHRMAWICLYLDSAQLCGRLTTLPPTSLALSLFQQSSKIILLSLFQNVRLSDEALLEPPTTTIHLPPFQNLKATRVRDKLNLEPCMVIKSKIEQARILLFLEPTILPSASQQT